MAGDNGRLVDPAYQWYPSDWLTSETVQVMTWAERGMYREILDYQWINGDVPADLRRLSRLIGATMEELEAAWRSVLRECFDVSEDGKRMWNPRLRREQMVREAYLGRSAEGGRDGADRRWGPVCEACGKRRGPVKDPCTCDSHPNTPPNGGPNGETITPTPPHPTPTPGETPAAAETLPEHLGVVVEKHVAPIRQEIQDRVFAAKGAIGRIGERKWLDALRASVLHVVLDAVAASGGGAEMSHERQQAYARAALRNHAPESRIRELMDEAERGGNMKPVRAALRAITREGL